MSWEQKQAERDLDFMPVEQSNEIVKVDLMQMLIMDSPQMREWRRAAVQDMEWDMTRKDHVYDTINMEPVHEMKANIGSYVLSESDIMTIVSTVMDKKQIDFERKQNTMDREMSDWENQNHWSIEGVVRLQFKKVINEHLTGGVVVAEVPERVSDELVMKGCDEEVEKTRRYVDPGTPGAKRGKRGGWHVDSGGAEGIYGGEREFYTPPTEDEFKQKLEEQNIPQDKLGELKEIFEENIGTYQSSLDEKNGRYSEQDLKDFQAKIDDSKMKVEVINDMIGGQDPELLAEPTPNDKPEWETKQESSFKIIDELMQSKTDKDVYDNLVNMNLSDEQKNDILQAIYEYEQERGFGGDKLFQLQRNLEEMTKPEPYGGSDEPDTEQPEGGEESVSENEKESTKSYSVLKMVDYKPTPIHKSYEPLSFIQLPQKTYPVLKQINKNW